MCIRDRAMPDYHPAIWILLQRRFPIDVLKYFRKFVDQHFRRVKDLNCIIAKYYGEYDLTFITVICSVLLLERYLVIMINVLFVR